MAVLEEEDGIRLRTPHRRLFILLSVLISLTTVGHQVCLFLVHYKVVYELSPAPRQLQVVPHALPTLLPVVIFPCCVFVLLVIMAVQRSTEGCGALVLAIHTFSSMLLTVTYPVQVIIYLWTHVHLYLQTHSIDAQLSETSSHCLCEPYDHPLTVVTEAQRCTCTSAEGQLRWFYFADRPVGNLTWYDLLVSADPEVSGSTVVNASSIHGGQEYLQAPDRDFYSINMMFVGLQASVLVMVLRMPLFIMWNDVEFTHEGEEARDNLRRKLRGRRVSVVAAVGGEGAGLPEAAGVGQVPAEDTSTQGEQEPKPRRKMRLRFLVALACFGFLEGADAFSLLNLFHRHPLYYATRPALTNTVLVFVSLTILIINYVNVVVTFPVTSRGRRRVWCLLVALVGNVPLLLARCWGLSANRGLHSVTFGDVSLLFVVKEVTLVMLGVGEYVLDECVSREVKRRLAAGDRTEPGPPPDPPQGGNHDSLFSTSFNLGSAFVSNTADKYIVGENKYKQQDQKRRSSKSRRRSSVVPFDTVLGDPPAAPPEGRTATQGTITVLNQEP